MGVLRKVYIGGGKSVVDGTEVIFPEEMNFAGCQSFGMVENIWKWL